MNVVSTSSGITATPYASGGPVSNSPITLQGDEETLTWYPNGSGTSPEWFGSETLTATRIGKYYVLGNQTTKGLQPKGNYATKEQGEKADSAFITKADKVSGAIAGNLAALDQNGNLQDSGIA